jgi:hypothetical protein
LTPKQKSSASSSVVGQGMINADRCVALVSIRFSSQFNSPAPLFNLETYNDNFPYFFLQSVAGDRAGMSGDEADHRPIGLEIISVDD